MIDKKFRGIAISVVGDYIGVAAEFAVDDAIAATLADKAMAANAQLQYRFFFSCLAKELPPDVPFQKVKELIVKDSGIQV